MTKRIFFNDARSCVIVFPSHPGTNNNTTTFYTSGPCVVQRPTGSYPRHGVLF